MEPNIRILGLAALWSGRFPDRLAPQETDSKKGLE